MDPAVLCDKFVDKMLNVKTEDEWCETNVAINVVMVSEVSSVNVACNHNFPRMVVSSATGCKNDPLNYVPMLES